MNRPPPASYADILADRVQAGRRVAVIGEGGIGFDVAELLSGDDEDVAGAAEFRVEWDVDPAMRLWQPNSMRSMRLTRVRDSAAASRP